MLTLLRTLKEGGRPTVHTLAARFHTRRETIYRDLKVLQQAGYPVTGDSAGCLSRPTLPADFRATALPLAFTKLLNTESTPDGVLSVCLGATWNRAD